jgi:hypothetical protein
MAHRQRDLVWSVLPWIEAHLRIQCQMQVSIATGRGGLERRPATPGSAVGGSDKIVRHGVNKIRARTAAILTSGRRAHSSGLFHVVVVGEVRHLWPVAAGLRRHGRDNAIARPL